MIQWESIEKAKIWTPFGRPFWSKILVFLNFNFINYLPLSSYPDKIAFYRVFKTNFESTGHSQSNLTCILLVQKVQVDPEHVIVDY